MFEKEKLSWVPHIQICVCAWCVVYGAERVGVGLRALMDVGVNPSKKEGGKKAGYDITRALGSQLISLFVYHGSADWRG